MSGWRERVKGEEGMTLIELAISVGLLGVVIGPIIVSFLLGLLESNSTRDRIADSSSAQLTTAYLHGDIQSSQSVATSGTCLPASLAGGTIRLQLQWVDPATPAVTTRVSYVEWVNGEGHAQLHRARCVGGASESTLLVHYVKSFVVECDGATPCASTTPKRVKVKIRAESDAPTDASSYEPFSFEIDGVRRVGT